MKLCIHCGEEKVKLLFTKDNRARDGLSTYCKACHNKKNRQLYRTQGSYAKIKYAASKRKYYQKPKGRYNAYINSVKTAFNKRISNTEFDSLLQVLLLEQQGCCDICKIDFSEIPTQYCIDHDHDTGAIRALLCNPCNIRRGR